MKTFNLFLISFIFATTLTFAQSNDEQEIRRLEKHWTELLDKGDTTSLLKIWSKDYVVNNPNGEIVTPEKIVLLMKNSHKFPKVERIIEKITFNQNIAIVMGKELQQPTNLTTNLEEWIPRRFTNVWIRSEIGWHLTARQSSEVIRK
ncbi:nuclear transport factor 2 family protein [Flavobacterium sp. XS2P12]|uniref:nuclear transport factor 2 family protein n=1 Tax=Flavobacterium melibiosi TaxID=3398734 RepID=UPI003A83C86D